LDLIKGASVGATGSRLISGNTERHEGLEAQIAQFHHAEAALLFGSGYEANIGVLSAIPTRNDTILYDSLIHASMRDGIRLSQARSYSFRHNDLNDLKDKLARYRSRGEVYIAVESLYSMDGDLAPLSELSNLADSDGAFLIVDEAHATGVYGPSGAGLVVDSGLADRIFLRVHTFGKALGYRGACIVGPSAVRNALINSARSFIYTTAQDRLTLELIGEAYKLLQMADRERTCLQVLIDFFHSLKVHFPNLNFLKSDSPIQGVIIPGNSEALAAEAALSEAGFAVRAIRAPTVPAGSERIRLCLHSFNSKEEIARALEILGHSLKQRVSLGSA
jgi:8-amino-7-oxononanoate synthase